MAYSSLQEVNGNSNYSNYIQVCVSDGQRLSVLVGGKNDIVNKLVADRGEGMVGMKEVKILSSTNYQLYTI